MKLDDIDKKLLNELTKDGRISYVELAKKSAFPGWPLKIELKV